MGPSFEDWYAYMLGLLRQEGVEYYGSVNHVDLMIHLSTAGFLVYPTNFPETGCITVMKAMTFGAIPITSRYERSVLANLTSRFDLGPAVPLSKTTRYETWLEEHWMPAFLLAASQSTSSLTQIRTDMMQYAHKELSWNKSADVFEEQFYA